MNSVFITNFLENENYMECSLHGTGVCSMWVSFGGTRLRKQLG